MVKDHTYICSGLPTSSNTPIIRTPRESVFNCAGTCAVLTVKRGRDCVLWVYTITDDTHLEVFLIGGGIDHKEPHTVLSCGAIYQGTLFQSLRRAKPVRLASHVIQCPIEDGLLG